MSVGSLHPGLDLFSLEIKKKNPCCNILSECPYMFKLRHLGIDTAYRIFLECVLKYTVVFLKFLHASLLKIS